MLAFYGLGLNNSIILSAIGWSGGKNVYEVLEFTVDEAIRFFPREEKLGQALWQLQQVGLGYLTLGQPATTLSDRKSVV